MQTFSTLVDDIAEVTCRKGEEQLIAALVNGAVRELESLGLYEQDLVEVRIKTEGASTQPFMWRDAPKNLRAISHVRYSNGVIPVPVKVGRKMEELKGNYYYIAGSYIAFSGAPLGGDIDVAYYQIQPRLKYYAAKDEQPAIREDQESAWKYRYFDPDTQRYSYVDTLGSEEADYEARAKVTNWLLEDYYEAVRAIAVREVFNAFNDVANSSTWTAVANNHKQIFKNLTGIKGIYT